MKLKLFYNMILLLTFCFPSISFSQEYSLLSPNKKNEIKITTDKKISFSVYSNNNELISSSPISLELENGTNFGHNPVIINTQKRTVDTVIYPVIKQKSDKIINAYNELKLNFKDNFSIVFRAYNNGVAYRFETNYMDSLKIKSEEVSFNFSPNDTIYFPQEESFISHNERLYKKFPFSQAQPDSFCSLPTLIKTHYGTNVLITEADLEDYPGLWLKINKEHTLTGIHPNYVLKAEVDRDKDSRIIKRADYIASTIGTRTYPWRVMMIAETDAGLILNQMVYLLSKPLQLKETSWIKPGKVAWDWWNALNIYGVDFKSGINTKTYKYYIDFASKYKIEYIILDEGWYKSSATEPGNPNIPGDITDVVPAINMKELLSYAKEKDVGIILWVAWKSLDRQ
ncbi:MAG: glycoside hydrolase family 97 N-terminal domain-containing protein, partial [Ignavibacteriaceae bacterium]